MPNSLFSKFVGRIAGLSRRDLLHGGSLFAAAGAFTGRASSAWAAPAASAPATGNIYRAIGVRPVINSRGTFTIITGSQTLPQVKAAMDEASRSFVQMDELMEGVGKRLAEITGAEWGIITGGCCAALTHCTTASVAGSNPERMQRLPDLTGLKSEVIIPEYSRNVYDHAIRMVGVKIIEVHDKAELEAAFNPQTAMIYILAGPGDEGPLGTRVICDVAKQHGVPVVVDAAAEVLTFPNVHLQRGATAVAYSGGKCIRGPQAAGLLLGDKNFLQAAWANSAPHHAYGRSLKVGKEEIMGMLTAVQMWKKRDHEAEWRTWEAWLDQIAASVERVNGVTTAKNAELALSNRSPRITISWEPSKIGITGQDVAKYLLDTEPRIVLGSAAVGAISITPYQMMNGDAEVVASRLYAVLSKPPQVAPAPATPTGQPASVAGQWEVTMKYLRGTAIHTLVLEQNADQLVGTHNGEYVSGDLAGTVAANQVHFRSSQKIQGTRISYEFTGLVDGDSMAGDVNMGEYGPAQWSARRHEYKMPGGVIRPVKPS